MAYLDAEDVSQSERNQQAGQTGDQRQQIIFLAAAKDLKAATLQL